MRCILLAGILLFSLIFGGNAGAKDRGSGDLVGNVSLLADQCGYVINKPILNKISRLALKINDRIISFDFYVLLRSVNGPIDGKLSFGCVTARSGAPKPDLAKRQTAAEEIAQADSGGRYTRGIIWQRKYEGDGWTGTIAYVNSVFGDQERLNAPDYFLICPDRGRLACFSFEIQNGKLENQEGDRIPELLRGIAIVGHFNAFKNSSNKQ